MNFFSGNPCENKKKKNTWKSRTIFHQKSLEIQPPLWGGGGEGNFFFLEWPIASTDKTDLQNLYRILPVGYIKNNHVEFVVCNIKD